VLEVGRARIRKAGNRYFADVSVGLSRKLYLPADSEQIADEVTAQVHQVLPNADVMVHSVRAPAAQRIFSIASGPWRRETISMCMMSACRT